MGYGFVALAIFGFALSLPLLVALAFSSAQRLVERDCDRATATSRTKQGQLQLALDIHDYCLSMRWGKSFPQPGLQVYVTK